jgi:hypothetical protein
MTSVVPFVGVEACAVWTRVGRTDAKSVDARRAAIFRLQADFLCVKRFIYCSLSLVTPLCPSPYLPQSFMQGGHTNLDLADTPLGFLRPRSGL